MNRFLNIYEELKAEKNKSVFSTAHQANPNQQQLNRARLAAQRRVQQAYLKLNGTNPTHGQQWQREGLLLAKKLIATSINNINDVVDKLSTMHTVLGSANRFTTQFDPQYCNSWTAYYNRLDRKIHTCPRFFTNRTAAGNEERIRTLIHEAAHAAGVGESGGESYIMVYDCSTTYNDINVADSWAHFVHCLLGLPTP